MYHLLLLVYFYTVNSIYVNLGFNRQQFRCPILVQFKYFIFYFDYVWNKTQTILWLTIAANMFYIRALVNCT